MIKLRPLTENDITDEVVAWFSKNEVNFYLDSKNLTRLDLITNLELSNTSKAFHMLAIEEIYSNKHIGNVKIGPINFTTLVADLVTVIGDPKFHGLGLGKKSIEIASDMAFEVYGIRKLSGKINVRNISSVKAYLGAGWFIEGILRDHDLRNGVVSDVYCVSKFNSVEKTI